MLIRVIQEFNLELGFQLSGFGLYGFIFVWVEFFPLFKEQMGTS